MKKYKRFLIQSRKFAEQMSGGFELFLSQTLLNSRTFLMAIGFSHVGTYNSDGCIAKRSRNIISYFS